MANILQCDSCEELRNNAPNLVVNGIGNTEVQNLIDDKGLSGNSDNCTDVNDMNDCLIGMAENEVDAYDTCDWKKFMHQFIPNLWTTLKAIISWLCGISCRLDYLQNGASFSFGETTTGKQSRLVKGLGVDFTLRSGSDQHASDVTIVYVGGALCYVHGSLITFPGQYRDANGVMQEGNSVWNFNADNYRLPSGGELMYEIRIKKSEYPQIKRLFRGDGWNGGGGQVFFETMLQWFDEGSYAYGQHGWCDDDGTPSSDGYSSGHLVPAGWMYVQCRMLYVGRIPIGDRTDGGGTTRDGSAISPHGYMGVRLNVDKITC